MVFFKGMTEEEVKQWSTSELARLKKAHQLMEIDLARLTRERDDLREALELWVSPYIRWSEVELDKRTDLAIRNRINVTNHLLAKLANADKETGG